MNRKAFKPTGINTCLYCGATSPDSEETCPNTGKRHTLVSASDKEVQGQGYNDGPSESPEEESYTPSNQNLKQSAHYVFHRKNPGIPLAGPFDSEDDADTALHGILQSHYIVHQVLPKGHYVGDESEIKDGEMGDYGRGGFRPEPWCQYGIRPPKLAHGDTGDSSVVRHCAFCFTADMKYMTREGLKSFGDTVGTIQEVLTAEAHQRHEGQWAKAEIMWFGTQPVMEVVLRRNKITKIVEATPDHRWLVKSNIRKIPDEMRIPQPSRRGIPRGAKSEICGRGHSMTGGNVRLKPSGTRDCKKCAQLATPVGGKSRSFDVEVLTKNLKPNQRLSYLRQSGVGDLKPSEEGIRHGIVFGDGSRTGTHAACVELWGEKDRQLLKYFGSSKHKAITTLGRSEYSTGVEGVRVNGGGLKSWMKDVPTSDDPSYLYGWIAGYLAADGTVGKNGCALISSANLDHLESVRVVAGKIGIDVLSIHMDMREGFPGREPSPLYTLAFVNSSLNEEMFLIQEHRDRFVRSQSKRTYDRIGWTVVEVRSTDRVEDVYCAVVPGTHSFALEDNIWVKNCGSGLVWGKSDGNVSCEYCGKTYSVQVQPEYPQMAQNISGTPIGPDGNPLPEGPEDGSEAPGEAGMPEDEGEAPAGPPGASEEPEGAEETINPKTSVYMTHEGVVLSHSDMINYLAIRHGGKRMIPLVRQANR